MDYAVGDAAAQYFAAEFYARAQESEATLASVLRAARQATRDQFPDAPTYLAYSLYAHPNAKLQFK